ncbi:hypothetical protein HYH03_013289 [Edaphochlamys debaryana]|uniref:Uncharacterized protein n=1 Tax=Edaphochlamys debaryana TaxID=47281 RepID=A0A835XR14_9CHLO|nr:hypothetical protein HYH03_013289 [Edaphochlamys debaryana]|eukprot:KAG2488144.1 hypothetical protein HYH03_013289 [Edaphochlamys debaryana]
MRAAVHSSRLLPPLRAPRARGCRPGGGQARSSASGSPLPSSPPELPDRSAPTFAAAIQSARDRAAEAAAASAVRLMRPYAAAHLHTREQAWFLFAEDPALGGEWGAGLRVWMLDGGRLETMLNVRHYGSLRLLVDHNGPWIPPGPSSVRGSGEGSPPLPEDPTPLLEPTKQALTQALRRQLAEYWEVDGQVDVEWLRCLRNKNVTPRQFTDYVRMSWRCFGSASRQRAAQAAADCVLPLLLQQALPRVHTHCEAFFLLAEDPGLGGD